jgi:hypothetical protein
MMTQTKQLRGYVDLTPTWTGVLPLLVEVAFSQNQGAREPAWIELKRMAKIADAATKYGSSARTPEDLQAFHQELAEVPA